jgi:hypothetical protein
MEELELLERQAEGIDALTEAAGPEGQAQAEAQAEVMLLADKNLAGIQMMLDLAGGTFGAFGFPSVAAVLSPDKKAMLAAVWSPVLTKYGVDLGELGGAYKEEIGALMVTAPIAVAIWAGLKADAASRAKAAEPAQPAAVEGAPA